jgi:hypothetical protein
MRTQEVKKKGEMFISIDNFDRYDITDCLDILRYLQTLDSQDLRTEDFKKIINKLESRIKYLVNVT